MKITYTLWQGNQLLSVNNKANSPEEILEVMKELKKLGEGFTYNVREVNTNEQIFNQHGAIIYRYSRHTTCPLCVARYKRDVARNTVNSRRVGLTF